MFTKPYGLFFRWPSAHQAAAAFGMALAVLCAAPNLAQALQGDCGVIATHGNKPLASDCLGILQHAVSKTGCAPFDPCVCDLDSSGNILASDALLCLNVAVGNPAFSLNCNCSTACYDSEAPTCGGTCPEGLLCAPDLFEPQFCECLNPCEADSAPTCAGDCSITEPGLSCAALTFQVQGQDPADLCACVPAGIQSCGDTAVPSCTGACSPGMECVDGGQGACVCSQITLPGPCANAAAPQCGGGCNPGFICRDQGGACACVPSDGQESCFDATTPVCGGSCDFGELCAMDIIGDCECFEACELSPAPACGGDCEQPGFTCTPTSVSIGGSSVDFCSCAPAPPPPTNPCWDQQAPTCNGDCPSGETCAPDPFSDEGGCDCFLPCELGAYPSCNGSCGDGGGLSCAAVSLELAQGVTEDFCFCIPPAFTTTCSASAGSGCDGACGDGSLCASDGEGGCRCETQPLQGACGSAEAPACAGTCTGPNVCTFTGAGGCACLPQSAEESCGRADYPSCGGVCSYGNFCAPAVSGECECFENDCEVSAAPACGGSCGPGESCTSVVATVAGGGSIDICQCIGNQP